MPLVKIKLRHLFVLFTNKSFQDLWISGDLFILYLLADGKYWCTACICKHISFRVINLLWEISIRVYERMRVMLSKYIHCLRHSAWHVLMMIYPGHIWEMIAWILTRRGHLRGRKLRWTTRRRIKLLDRLLILGKDRGAVEKRMGTR